MDNIFVEVLIVFFLTLLNGFFSMSEIALISVRKTRIASLAKQGNNRAKVIQSLHQDPEKLFATIQIGISVITIFASAFAGASISEELAKVFAGSGIEFFNNNAYTISFISVVVVVSYVNVVIGELVPKSLGLRYAENFSLLSAYPILWLSSLSSPLIRLLNLTSNAILSIFKDSTNFLESRLSEEEIRTLIKEGKQAGTIEAREHEILENVFEFSDTPVSKIMTPRAAIIAYDINEPVSKTLPKAIEQGFSRIPFYDGDLDRTVGLLHLKDLLPYFGKDFKDINLKQLLLPVFFVPSSQKINNVLQQFQRKKIHEALVTDEHGSVEGLITLEDVLEELVGEISDEDDESPRLFIKEKDGSYTVFGQALIVDFNKFFRTNLPEDGQYNTVSGFVMEKLGRFGAKGDLVETEKFLLRVKEASERVIKSIQVKRK